MTVSDDFAAESSSRARTSSPGLPDSESASEPGEREGDSSTNGAGSSSSASDNRLIESLLRFVEEVAGTGRKLIEVYTDRARLSVQRKIVHAAIGACVAIGTAIWLGAAALATLRGLCGGMTALWGGREWMGDLTGGLLALAITAGAIALYLRASTRRELARLERKYERIRSEHSQQRDTAPTAGDGATVA